jgi:signal transduction histidine kinase
MKLNTEGKIRAGYIAAFILLFVAYLFIYSTIGQMNKQSQWINHTNEVITRLELLVSNIKDAETGVRGYVIMKDNKFLSPYYSGIREIPKESAALRVLTRDNLLQQKRLDTLQGLIDIRLTTLRNNIEIFRNAGYVLPDSVKEKGYQSKQVMDDIRAMIKKMSESENVALSDRIAELRSYTDAVKVINITAVLIAFLLALYSIITFTRESHAKNNYRKQLETKLDDLTIMNTELLQLRSLEKFTSTGRIARTIAHEVRNPLTNIGLASEQLKDTVQSEESALYLDMIKRNADRINVLVSELLNSTKFADLSPVKISVNTILDDALALAKDRVALQELTVEKKYTAGIGEVAVDVEKITIAFLNIIVNAIEAMEPGKGILTLQTKAEKRKCVVVISDNGTGMDKETVSKLFEPYFTSKEKGNGLGLTNTQNIILNHKGTIKVESEPGNGTSFIITLDFA